MRRRRFLIAIGLAGTIGVTGCVSPPTGGADGFDVGMSANAFLPDSLTVDTGDTVTWLNNGSRAHTVTAYENGIPDGAGFFASGGFTDESTARDAWTEEEGGIIHPGESFEYTFDIAGRYTYFCIPHEVGGMVADVVVEE